VPYEANEKINRTLVILYTDLPAASRQPPAALFCFPGVFASQAGEVKRGGGRQKILQ
jgi:hypothetical protein